MIGERIGTYRILRQLGEGGMGTVWLAEHVMIGRRAAIKMLHPHISSQPDLTQRFFQEAKAAAAVQDAGIVQIFDFGQHSDGRAYLVMELLEGESLEQRLGKVGRLAPGEALRILEQVASSIGAVHHRGIVHRDLKPDNIYLVRDVAASGGERAKILDFGIAKIANAGLKTMTSVVMGTPMFMSPEQCRGAGNIDGRSDVYALGCVLFLVLTGRPPFFAEGVGDLIAMHLREPAPAPSSLVPGIPPGIDALVLRCLEKEVARRFPHAGALAEALAAQLAQLAQQPGTSQPMAAALALTPALAATTPLPVLPGPLGPPGSSGPPGRLGPTTTLTSTSGSRTARPPGGRSPLMGWLYVGIAAAVISMSAAVITSLQDASPAELPVTNVTLPAASSAPGVTRVTGVTRATGATDVTGATGSAAAEPGTGAAPEPAPVAAPPPSPQPSPPPSALRPPTPPPTPPVPSSDEAKAPTRPAAAPSKPRAAALDLGTIGGTPGGTPGDRENDSATSCAEERAALDAFIKRSYQAPPAAALKQARALPTGCFDKNQRYRFALVAISLACKSGDRASAQRFFALGADASLRDRCPALLR